MFTNNKTLSYEALNSKYPKGMEALRAWVEQGLKAFQELAAKESGGESTIPDLTKSIVEKSTMILLQTAYRDIFDFMDINGVFISIRHSEDNYLFSVDYKNEFITGGDERTRASAEIEAILTAFEILEKQL